MASPPTRFFDLRRQPRPVLIVGGGYVAIELASVFAALGGETTIVHRGDKVLRGFDDEVRRALMAGLEQRGITVTVNEQLTAIRRRADCLDVTTRSGDSDQGRRGPAGDRPQSQYPRSGPREGRRHHRCGGCGRWWTPIRGPASPTIYAVGDVTDRMQFTPVAIREGAAFVETVFGGEPTAVDYENVPVAVFGNRKSARSACTEEEARLQYDALDIYRAYVKPLPTGSLAATSGC